MHPGEDEAPGLLPFCLLSTRNLKHCLALFIQLNGAINLQFKLLLAFIFKETASAQYYCYFLCLLIGATTQTLVSS